MEKRWGKKTKLNKTEEKKIFLKQIWTKAKYIKIDEQKRKNCSLKFKKKYLFFNCKNLYTSFLFC